MHDYTVTSADTIEVITPDREWVFKAAEQTFWLRRTATEIAVHGMRPPNKNYAAQARGSCCPQRLPHGSRGFHAQLMYGLAMPPTRSPSAPSDSNATRSLWERVGSVESPASSSARWQTRLCI